MANEVLQKTGTAIVLADTTDHSPSANNNLGTRTDQIDLTSLAAAAARQSNKFDFGATRAKQYSLIAALEWATAPAAGEVVDFYIAFSPSGTAAVANPGGVSGSDAAYAGYSANLEDSLLQLTFIGSFVNTVQATTTVQIATVGRFDPLQRYGTLVVVNRSAADALMSDAVEMSVLIEPAVDEIQ
jgi:hypothetical protein